MECYEKGVITAPDLDGIEMKVGRCGRHAGDPEEGWPTRKDAASSSAEPEGPWSGLGKGCGDYPWKQGQGLCRPGTSGSKIPI